MQTVKAVHSGSSRPLPIEPKAGPRVACALVGLSIGALARPPGWRHRAELRSSRPQPNESCGAIHNRMPAVLAREVWRLWLGAQDAIRTPRPRLPRSTRSSLVAEHDAPLYGLLNSAIGSDKHMPLRQEVRFLRERARRLREMAEAHQTALSDQLRMMAHELEARADELERPGFIR